MQPVVQTGAAEAEADADILRMRRDLPTLEAVERRRGQLWVIASILLLAASASVFLLIADPEAASLIPDSVGIRLGFGGTSVAFLLYVFDQERRLRRLSEALVRERILSAALTSRVRDLGTLTRVGQIVNAVLSQAEVLEIVLEGAFELTAAATGSVMLVDGEELQVAVSAGAGPAPRGSRQPLTAGVAGWVATKREPLLITGQLNDGQIPELRERRRGSGSSVCAPMLVADELVGVLALERADGAAPFTEWEMRAVTLFAAHAATAVSNSRRYEQERENVERLAQLVESRGETVATMVHDLKAPLTAIIGFSKLMKHRGDIDAETRAGFVTRIEDAAFQLLEMIEGVLQGASDDAQLDVRRDPIDVRRLVQELVELTASMAQGRDGVARPVALVCAEDEVALRLDGAALRSILVNLLENAVKYSPPGSPIEVGITRTDREVHLTVRDEGEGIPEDQLETIFERFRQRDPQAPGRSGVGLGLYIVRSLAQAHGGRVSVRSELGAGTTFTVAFPGRMLTETTSPATLRPGIRGGPRPADQPIIAASRAAVADDSGTSMA
ncbi:MAG: GAF domain-containing sensor histidine kinase [Actinobacteria bacterium]|nr:GAF domain-containing sensor histidine kinase [Actinomycetota bacterium]